MFKLNQFTNIATYITALLALLVLSACASTPKTDFDPNTDFSKYQTYQWQYSENSSEREVADPVYDSPLFEKKLESAIANIMLNRGFNGSDEPDMYFTYHMADAKRKNYPMNIAIGYGRYSRHSYWNVFAPRLRDLERDEILVIVDALDSSTQELIWRGWTKTSRRTTPHSPAEMTRLAQRILAGFPPE